MNNVKIWFVSMLLILTAAACYFTYTLAGDYGARSLAQAAIDRETSEIESENKKLKAQTEEYSADISEGKENIENSSDINAEIDKFYEQITEHQTKIKELNKEYSELEKEEESLKNLDVDLTGISNDSTGDPADYKDRTLVCPTDIPVGRYKLSGTGFFRVVTAASNTVTESQNLANVDDNTYTINLTSGSNLIVEGTVTVTPVN